MLTTIRTVMAFVDDPVAAAAWWATQLGVSMNTEHDGDAVYVWLDVGGVEWGFHAADEKKNPQGGSPVVYWAVTDFPATRNQLIDAGCTPYRGPLRIADSRQICQLKDPFGTIIGLDGP